MIFPDFRDRFLPRCPPSRPHHSLFCLIDKPVRSARLSQCINTFCNFAVKFCVSFRLNLVLSRLVNVLLNHNMVITKTSKAAEYFLATDATQWFSPPMGSRNCSSVRCRETTAELPMGRMLLIILQDQNGPPPKDKIL